MREWPLAEVGREEMLWAPDGLRFAYVKRAAPMALLSSNEALPGGADLQGVSHSGAGKMNSLQDSYRIVIRNIRGDSVNEFTVYRPGKPADLDWIDNNQLGYLAPPDKTGQAYILHAVDTGEILRVLRGSRFVWSPGRKHLAYVSSSKHHDAIKVNGQMVWPRAHSSSPRTRRKIISDLVWSPEGTGLAFLELDGKKGNLVVLLVVDNRDGDLIWPVPKGALKTENHLFWAENKVMVGRSPLEPRFAASWDRVQ